MAWLCIHTRPRQEELVSERLLDLALDTFLPRRRITVADKSRPGHSRSQLTPQFPRYLFADVHESDYAEVPLTRGISSVVSTLGFDDQPQFLTVPVRAIELLRRPPVPHLTVGQSIWLEGPLQGLQTIIRSIAHLDTTGHVQVWLDMLGTRRSVDIHHSLIRTEARVE